LNFTLIVSVIEIVIGIFFADWATSDDLTLQYHGWPEVLRRRRAHRLFFHLTGMLLVVAGVTPFFMVSLEASFSVIIVLVGFFFFGVLQILPLLVFRSLERLRRIFRH